MPSEFETLLVKMDEGFGKVYDKIDGLRDDFVEHMPVCAEKFASIDKRLTVQEAVNGVKNAQAKEKRDYWKYFIRTAIVIITAGMASILWKIFISNIAIIR